MLVIILTTEKGHKTIELKGFNHITIQNNKLYYIDAHNNPKTICLKKIKSIQFVQFDTAS